MNIIILKLINFFKRSWLNYEKVTKTDDESQIEVNFSMHFS